MVRLSVHHPDAISAQMAAPVPKVPATYPAAIYQTELMVATKLATGSLLVAIATIKIKKSYNKLL